MASPRNFEFFG